MDCSEEYIKLEMECEPKKSFRRGRSCSRQTGLLVLLGTVCMIIFIIMTSVIFSHQESSFSMLERWMSSHTSDLTSVKSDFQISEVHEKKLSNIETLITELGSSLSSHGSKQEENQQKLDHQKDLMDDLKSAVSALEFEHSHDSLMALMVFEHVQMEVKNSVDELRSIVQALSYKLSLTNSLTSGCTETEWIQFSNSCYLFSSHSMNWTQAKDYCEEQGALLLKLEDASEKEWKFVTHLTKPLEYWIGLTEQTTGQWRWADDTPCTMDKVHWAPVGPDGHQRWRGEDCAHITQHLNINYNFCYAKMKFICKGPMDSQ